MKQMNWAQAWGERLLECSHTQLLKENRSSSEEFWDKYTSWEKLHHYTQYPGKILDRIRDHVRQEYSVLDIGAGSGAFAVPLAKLVHTVTAIEPSPEQINRLLGFARKEGLLNITTIQKTWEEINLQELNRHDIVIAAYSFFQMHDITPALKKMVDVAERWLFLIHFASHDFVEPLQSVLGQYNPGPDFLYLYHVLHEMGFYANLEIFTRDYEIPLDLQMEAVGQGQGLREGHKQQLIHYLESHQRIFFHNGTRWLKRQCRDALLSLRKENR
jgi:SAM-dependent methyltransferase